jgi:hypothetical protein
MEIAAMIRLNPIAFELRRAIERIQREVPAAEQPGRIEDAIVDALVEVETATGRAYRRKYLE